jgi:hypothetical protein
MTVEPIDRLDSDPVAKTRLVEALVGLHDAEWDALGRAARRLGPELDAFRDALLDLMLHESRHPLPQVGARGVLDSPFIRWRDDALDALGDETWDDPAERQLAESAFRKITEIVHIEMFLAACARSMHSSRETDEPLPMVAALVDGHRDRRNAA